MCKRAARTEPIAGCCLIGPLKNRIVIFDVSIIFTRDLLIHALCYDIQSTIFSSASLAAFVQIIYNASSTSRSLDTHPPTPHIWLMCWKELLQQLDPSLFIDGLLGQPFVEIKEGLLASPQCHSSTSTSRSSAIAALLLLLLLPLSAEHYVPPHFIIRLAACSE